MQRPPDEQIRQAQQEQQLREAERSGPPPPPVTSGDGPSAKSILIIICVVVVVGLLLIQHFNHTSSSTHAATSEAAASQKAPMPTPTITYNPDAVNAARNFFAGYVGVDWYGSITNYSVENQRLIIDTNIYLDTEGEKLIQRICKVAHGYISSYYPAGISHYAVNDQSGSTICSG